jgi:hypothetical protein
MKTFKKILKYLFLTVFILFTIIIIIGIYFDTEDLQFNREMEKRISKLELNLNDTIFKMDNDRFLKLSSSYEDSLNLYVGLSNEVEFSEQNKNIFNDLINSSRVKLEKKGIEIKKEEEERLKKEKEERLKKEEEERLKREKEREIKRRKERQKAKDKSMKYYCFTKKPYVLGSSPSLSYKFFKNGKFVLFSDYGNRYYEGKYKFKNDQITLYKTWISPQETETLYLIRNCTTLKDNSGYWWNGD